MYMIGFLNIIKIMNEILVFLYMGYQKKYIYNFDKFSKWLNKRFMREYNNGLGL